MEARYLTPPRSARPSTTCADVRALHEDVFYRLIIAATASLSEDEASLHAEGARDRLAATAIATSREPAHVALTQGTSRRAAIQRHLPPVFISWLATALDPDMGLLTASCPRITGSRTGIWRLARLPGWPPAD